MGYSVQGMGCLIIMMVNSPPHRPGGGTTETPSDVVGDSSPDTGQDMSYDYEVVENVPPYEVVPNVPPYEVVQSVPPHEVQR